MYPLLAICQKVMGSFFLPLQIPEICKEELRLLRKVFF